MAEGVTELSVCYGKRQGSCIAHLTCVCVVLAAKALCVAEEEKRASLKQKVKEWFHFIRVDSAMRCSVFTVRYSFNNSVVCLFVCVRS